MVKQIKWNSGAEKKQFNENILRNSNGRNKEALKQLNEIKRARTRTRTIC